MRNYKSSFQRTGEISREPSQCSDWLEAFAEKMAVQEQTAKTPPSTKTAGSKSAVEVARDRQQDQPSIYEMMSSILSGQKPKYSSVEEAVLDYQNRTGLAQYLKAQSEDRIKDIAFQIAQASEEEDECCADDEGCVEDESCADDSDEDDQCMADDAYSYDADDECMADDQAKKEDSEEEETVLASKLYSFLANGNSEVSKKKV